MLALNEIDSILWFTAECPIRHALRWICQLIGSKSITHALTASAPAIDRPARA